jgi:hypothetical protein
MVRLMRCCIPPVVTICFINDMLLSAEGRETQFRTNNSSVRPEGIRDIWEPQSDGA